MSKFNNGGVKHILVFNSRKLLIGFFYSGLEAAKTLQSHSQSIHYACTGRCISVKNLYLRHLSNNIEIEPEDFGSLRLEEYDGMCGVKRKTYPDCKMSKKGMKYSKTKSNQKV
jgi:hypothetical protein